MNKSGIIWKQQWNPATKELTFENVGRVVLNERQVDVAKQTQDKRFGPRHGSNPTTMQRRITRLRNQIALSLVVVLILCSVAQSNGAVYTAASASFSDVFAKVALTTNGDTVNIPTGTANWTGNQITITNSIDIEGAGTNLTIITNSDDNTFFYCNNKSSTRLVTIGNMSLKQPDNQQHGGKNVIQAGDSFYIHLHHLYVTNGYEFFDCDYGHHVGDRGVGCIDHCVIVNTDIALQLNGNVDSCLDPIVPGTTNTLVIEDNAFIQGAAANTSDNQEQIQSGHGVRFVVRHCVFDYSSWPGGVQWAPFEWHGFGGFGGENTSWWSGEGTSVSTYAPHFTNDTECLRGPPIVEVYSNTFITGSSMTGGRTIHHRGGSALIYGNNVTGPNVAADASIVEMDNDEGSTGFFASWSRIDNVENTYMYSNYVNGVLANSSFYSQPTGIATNGQDYFLAPPAASGQGAITWTDFPGGHVATFASGASPYFPYTPLVYPDPLVTSVNQQIATSTWPSTAIMQQ